MKEIKLVELLIWQNITQNVIKSLCKICIRTSVFTKKGDNQPTHLLWRWGSNHRSWSTLWNSCENLCPLTPLLENLKATVHSFFSAKVQTPFPRHLLDLLLCNKISKKKKKKSTRECVQVKKKSSFNWTHKCFGMCGRDGFNTSQIAWGKRVMVGYLQTRES